MKIQKWQHLLFREYKRRNLASYLLDNAVKTCLYELKISENIEIKHVFQSKSFFHLSNFLHTSSLSAFNTFQPPPSSLQHPQQYLNQNIARNWAISPNLGQKIKSCPF